MTDLSQIALQADERASTGKSSAKASFAAPSRVRVMMVGLRAPSAQGGVEKHIRHLAGRLAELGCEVEVVVRTPYTQPNETLDGARLTSIWAPRNKSLEAFFHTFFAVIYAGVRRPDVLHLHAIGPGLFTPMARALGLTVVVTHHGHDYDREKWGALARAVLRLGERAAARAANHCITVSKAIAAKIMETYGVVCTAIPNGVPVVEPGDGVETLARFGLTARGYILTVGRIVPEKRHMDLIAAYADAKPTLPLVIVGGVDHADAYAASVAERAAQVENVKMLGFQTGSILEDLFAQARLFVLPSSHEGLPIALLEALSYGVESIASNIPANLELELPPENYFPVGDIAQLRSATNARLAEPYSEEASASRRARVRDQYDWSVIARSTYEVYLQALNR